MSDKIIIGTLAGIYGPGFIFYGLIYPWWMLGHLWTGSTTGSVAQVIWIILIVAPWGVGPLMVSKSRTVQ